jgi:heme/copper-type cytochrome/quinol oxidase subunit 2
MRNVVFVLLVSLLLVVSVTFAFSAHPADPPVPFAVPMGSDGVQRANITLDSYSYTPNYLIVEAGKPVELILTSVTFITPHNFIIKELGVQQDVSAGKTLTVKFTPAKAGTYLIHCDKKLLFLPSHREEGMEGKLEVK